MDRRRASMQRQRNRLNTHLIRAIGKPGLHADGGGLYLRVQATGGRSWVYRYQRNGRRRDMGLGSVAAVDLREAREKAACYQRWVRKGLDPIEMVRTLRWARAIMEDGDRPKPKPPTTLCSSNEICWTGERAQHDPGGSRVWRSEQINIDLRS
jgi:hypothetical protein